MRGVIAATVLGFWIFADLLAHLSNIFGAIPGWITIVPFKYGSVPYEAWAAAYWGVGFVLWMIVVSSQRR